MFTDNLGYFQSARAYTIKFCGDEYRLKHTLDCLQLNKTNVPTHFTAADHGTITSYAASYPLETWALEHISEAINFINRNTRDLPVFAIGNPGIMTISYGDEKWPLQGLGVVVMLNGLHGKLMPFVGKGHDGRLLVTCAYEEPANLPSGKNNWQPGAHGCGQVAYGLSHQETAPLDHIHKAKTLLTTKLFKENFGKKDLSLETSFWDLIFEDGFGVLDGLHRVSLSSTHILLSRMAGYHDIAQMQSKRPTTRPTQRRGQKATPR